MYGRKHVVFADEGDSVQCLVVVKEISPTKEQVGRFSLPYHKVMEYCNAKKINLVGFNTLVVDKREMAKRLLSLKFSSSMDKFETKYNGLYRKHSVKNKEKLISKINNM